MIKKIIINTFFFVLNFGNINRYHKKENNNKCYLNFTS